MPFQRLTFKNAQGDPLAARLDLPLDEKPTAYALFAHCFTCTKNLKALVHINRALTAKGIAVLRFDFTGLGESEGDFAETNFSSNVADLVAAADFLESHFEAPQLLIGHSLGGAAVLQAAAKISSSVAVVTIAAPANPSDLGSMLGSTKEEIEAKGEAEVTMAGRRFKLKRQFIDDLEKVHMLEAIRNLKRALLVVHSPQDEIVGIENAWEIFQAAEHPKSFLSLDHADHLISDRADSLYLGSVVAAWARKYVRVYDERVPARDLADNRVVVRTGEVGYQTEIIANDHHLIADEPVAAGGANTGPTPYEFLVAGLGACTSMTIRMYADRKKWPLKGVVVRLKHRKVHKEDCQDCDVKSRKIDLIEREIELLGSLSRQQRDRLLEIADRCPVHRTLRSETLIESRLKE
jgi:putative redox protein